MRRREVLSGGAAALVAGPAPAAETRRAFRSGPLADSPVAANFKTAPGLHLPNVTLRDGQGRPRRLDAIRRPALVTLWEETCTPCLAEAPDLARLAVRHPGVRFLAVLTNSPGRLDYAHARSVLDRVGAQKLPTWVEAGGGREVGARLASTPQSPRGQYPCVLLIDARARVAARAFGYTPADPAALNRLLQGAARTSAGGFDPGVMERIQGLPSSWSTPAADAFIEALGRGALDHAAG